MKKYLASVITFILALWVLLIPFYLSSHLFWASYIPIPSAVAIVFLSLLLGFIGYRYISHNFKYIAGGIACLSLILYFAIPYSSVFFPILRDGIVFSKDAVCSTYFCVPMSQEHEAACDKMRYNLMQEALNSGKDPSIVRDEFESKPCIITPEQREGLALVHYKKGDRAKVFRAERMEGTWYYELENGMSLDRNMEYWSVLVPGNPWTDDVFPLSWWISYNF